MTLSGLLAGSTDLDNMAMIRAATAAQNLDLAEPVRDCPVIRGQFLWIARIQFLGLVQFRMAAAGGVGADGPDPIHPAFVTI